MKEYLFLNAKYNKEANEKVQDIILKMKEEDYQKDNGAYFKSIKGIFEHILVADMIMFTFIKNFAEKTTFDNDALLGYTEGYNLKKEANKDLQTLFDTREKMNNLIIEILNSINDFTKLEEMTDYSGKKHLKKRIQIIMHVLNHATHHRGEISALLDKMGYKNDYSSLMSIEI